MDPAEKIVQRLRVALIAIVSIVAIYLVADHVIRNFDLPSWITWIILGIAALFIYSTRKDIENLLK